MGKSVVIEAFGEGMKQLQQQGFLSMEFKKKVDAVAPVSFSFDGTKIVISAERDDFAKLAQTDLIPQPFKTAFKEADAELSAATRNRGWFTKLIECFNAGHGMLPPRPLCERDRPVAGYPNVSVTVGRNHL